MLCVECCSLFVVCWLSCDVICLLPLCCLMFVDRCLLFVVCRVLFVVVLCLLLIVVCWLCVVCCSLYVVSVFLCCLLSFVFVGCC